MVADFHPIRNLGPSYAWNKAVSQEHWRSVVDMAIRLRRACHEEEVRKGVHEEEEKEDPLIRPHLFKNPEFATDPAASRCHYSFS